MCVHTPFLQSSQVVGNRKNLMCLVNWNDYCVVPVSTFMTRIVATIMMFSVIPSPSCIVIGHHTSLGALTFLCCHCELSDLVSINSQSDWLRRKIDQTPSLLLVCFLNNGCFPSKILWEERKN